MGLLTCLLIRKRDRIISLEDVCQIIKESTAFDSQSRRNQPIEDGGPEVPSHLCAGYSLGEWVSQSVCGSNSLEIRDGKFKGRLTNQPAWGYLHPAWDELDLRGNILQAWCSPVESWYTKGQWLRIMFPTTWDKLGSSRSVPSSPAR